MKNKFEIKNLFIFLATINALLISISLLALYFLSSSYEQLRNAEYSRYQSYLLIDELRQSSDDLTRLARSYVVTGDQRYKDQYNQILGIRDGKKPRFLNPERIYWDYLAVEGLNPPRENGNAIALTKLMKDAGFNEIELNLLQQSKNNSDKLVDVENRAMNLASSQHKNTDEIKMLFDQKYHDYKLSIMKPMDDVYQLLDERTKKLSETTFQKAKYRENLIYVLLIISLVILVLILKIVYHIIWRKLGAEPEFVADIVKRVSKGEIVGEIEFQNHLDKGNLLSDVKQLCNYLEVIAVCADTIGQGDLSKNVPLQSEKDRLGSAINNMINLLRITKMSLEKNQQRLQESNDQMEETIKIRTAALEEAKLAAENANRAKSEFLDIAAHELRNPITVISLLLQVTQKQLSRGMILNPNIIEKLQVPTNGLSRLVVELLDVSRLERGKVELQLELCDISALVLKSIEEFQLRAPERTFNFSKTDEQIEVEIDPLRINQVISNLLDNAIKYTPENSPIDIKVELLKKQVRVSVKDYGQGISSEQLKNIFTPFVRGNTDLIIKAGGLGLGLSICRSMIELHGGTIGVYSEINQGSTFFFELPLLREHPATSNDAFKPG